MATETSQGNLIDKLVKVKRCAAVVKGGRRFSFAAMVVEGNDIQKIFLPYSGWVSARDGSLNGGCPGFDEGDVVMD